MRLLRSWPAAEPPGRACVRDSIPRLVISDHEYRPLGDVDDDVLLLEWDIAVGREDLAEFAARAAVTPGRVLVAPYRLYCFSSGRDRPRPVWAHRRYEGDPQTGTLRQAGPDDPSAHLWGLGMTYLPREVIHGFLTDWPGRVDDVSLSGWHYNHVAREVPITWDIRPVHLHYRVPDMPGGQRHRLPTGGV